MDRQPHNSAFVCFDNATLRLDDRCLFSGFSWTMRTGERWAVVGPTGAGKSILARALGGRVPVVSGSIRYFFEGEGDLRDSRCWVKPGEVIRVGIESHGDVLHAFAGYHQARWEANEAAHSPRVADWLGLSGPDDRAEGTLHLLGIRDLLKRNVVHLSYGEMRKALIARALLLKPRLLILDDPFGGLDTASRDALKGSIGDLLGSEDQVLLILLSRLEELPEGITHLLAIRDMRIVGQGVKERVRESLADWSQGRKREQDARRFHARDARDASDAKERKLGERARGVAPLINIRNASVSYKEKRVLMDVSWEVNAGEHWAVMGPNGSGKSTLLSLVLADNPQAYENDISLFGRRRGSGETVWEIKKRIGWVSSELLTYYEDDKLTCEQVVCSGFYDSIGLFRNCTEAQVSASRWWVAWLGLTPLLARPFRAISAGEKRLLLLARALVKEPEMVILDEPCLGLDSGYRARVLELTQHLCPTLTGSLIYVTHDPQEIGPWITHLLRLREGRVEECGMRNTEWGMRNAE